MAVVVLLLAVSFMTKAPVWFKSLVPEHCTEGQFLIPRHPCCPYSSADHGAAKENGRAMPGHFSFHFQLQPCFWPFGMMATPQGRRPTGTDFSAFKDATSMIVTSLVRPLAT